MVWFLASTLLMIKLENKIRQKIEDEDMFNPVRLDFM